MEKINLQMIEQMLHEICKGPKIENTPKCLIFDSLSRHLYIKSEEEMDGNDKILIKISSTRQLNYVNMQDTRQMQKVSVLAKIAFKKLQEVST